jgi:site-specific DNA-methyltransferase (adenine-specific)
MIEMQEPQKIVVKKQKKVKSKLSDDIIIEDTINIKLCEEKCVRKKIKKIPKILSDDIIISDNILIIDSFIKQERRIDILKNMLNYKHLSCDELFNKLMLDNKDSNNVSRQGYIYETLIIILIVLKCFTIDYTEIYYGQIQNLTKIENFNKLLKDNISSGNNKVDMTIKQENNFVFFSIKYQDKYGETDVSKIDNTSKEAKITNSKIGLFVKDKNIITSHKYKNKENIDKILHDKIGKDKLLFDKDDVIQALNVFCRRFSCNKLNVKDFIDKINSEYLLSPRKQLIEKLHQTMNKIKFQKSVLKNTHKMWCIAHKPRSGKSITILSICKYLLENGYNKILIMTSVPATIGSFINDLNKYIDFKNINYKLQKEFDTVDELYNGIVFCSVQYLKTDGKSKKELLKNIGFDVIITDESHQGSSTDKTKTDILEVNSDVEDIRKNIKLTIFASGTADKTKKYYKIKNEYVYEWTIEDEGYMKELFNPSCKNREELVDIMVARHGEIFLECLHDTTLNRDYSKHPTQVLMKHSISEYLINDIKEYNSTNGTNFGYNCASLFALQTTINSKKEVEYIEEFELCKTTDGINILIEFFNCIISSNLMKKTIMKQIEETQSCYRSRKSTIKNPLLFIIYLPTHTRNNTISLLQKTFKKFLETYDLWSDYNIEYSNSLEDTGNVKEEYNDYIQTIMTKTKTENKRGCILLLGNKGSVGITYNECDVTISLDDGHNLDNQRQRFSRALTEADGKTIGINVDMNIQRTYLYLVDVIQRHRRSIKTTKTISEILYYLYEHNIFLFDPQEFNNGKIKTTEIISYYETVADKLMREIDDTPFLENLICHDDMKDFIKLDYFQKIELHKINRDLEGDQQDCPKGDKSKTQIDAPEGKEPKEEKELTEEEKAIIENLINQTYEMCKSFLFPLLALISRSYKIFDFNEIFINEKTSNLIITLLQNKIELNKDNFSIIKTIMEKIIDENEEIVNNIREIYSIASPKKLRELIEKHFIPTNDEKKQNAEVPTPVKLVDDMLNTIPIDFWKTPNKVFEPCCGKGNFVLGIFDKFYKGLKELFPDEIDRCRIIMTQCIYYADLNALNVFITTEIIKCHVQSYCGLEELDYEFNSYTGDTLKLNIEEHWGYNLNEFSIIGNPPYSTNPSKPDTKPLYDKFIEKYINGKLLLFVVPSRWFIGGKGLDSFRDFMKQRKDIVFIRHEDNATKWFGNNVEIKGGVNYFLKDTSYNGLCLFNDNLYNLSIYDCIIKPKYHKIIDMVLNMESINKLYMGRYFGVETNDKRFKDNGKIKCYVSTLKSKDRCKYIDDYTFNETNTFWKVITPRAAFGAFSGFGTKFIGNPNEIHTGSYISFRVNNEEEAKSLLSYLDTKFANYMLSIRKISQDISENTCKWIPLVPLDRIWTDEKVCEYLKIEKTMYV